MYKIQDNANEALSAKFSWDSSYLAVSYGDSSVGIYSSMLGDPIYRIKSEEHSFPMTAISWKPQV